MARVEVRLLGRPTVLIDGVAVPPPKGAKPWGLLAYLAATGQAHPRPELADLLFSEAADPLGALRWNLSELRRLLDRPDALRGPAVGLDASDMCVDTRRLEDGDLAVFDSAASCLLLAGVSFADSPRFELWLSGERVRIQRRCASLCRVDALRALAAGDPDLAVRRAENLVTIEPFDEGHHALLIRAHAAAGDTPAARASYERCRDFLRRELSVEPGQAVVAATHFLAQVGVAPGTADLHHTSARLTVAWQSFLAGSVVHGVDLGRGVVAMADRGDDVGLKILARLYFSAMLNIAVRGWDEGAAVATQALHLAEQSGRSYEEATARGILAGIDLMRADYPAATAHATIGLAGSGDPGAKALNLTFLSAVEADIGEGARAVDDALEAVALAEVSADPMRIGYATAYAGHALLLAGDLDGARPQAERAVEVLEPMLVLVPWPLAMCAEIEVYAGDLERSSACAARAGAIAATTGVAYQQALALRAEALADSARGDHDAAVDKLTIALGFARRTTGEGYSFHWPVAWTLDSLARISAHGDPDASRYWTEALLDHATTVGMRTFIRRGERLLERPDPTE